MRVAQRLFSVARRSPTARLFSTQKAGEGEGADQAAPGFKPGEMGQFSPLDQSVPPELTQAEFYQENFLKSVESLSIEQFNFEFRGRKINIIGMPLMLENKASSEQAQAHMKNLAEVIVDLDKAKRCIVQLDPTNHVLQRRELTLEMKRKSIYKDVPVDASDELLTQTPYLPLDEQELIFDPLLFEVIKADGEQMKQLFEILRTRDEGLMKNFKGYFVSRLHGKSKVELESEENQKVLREYVQLFDSEVLVTESERRYQDAKQAAILKSLMGVPVHLGQIPDVYLRLIFARSHTLQDLRSYYNQVLVHMRDLGMRQIELARESLLSNVFQLAIDYYLYGVITRVAAACRGNDEDVSVYVRNVHVQPLKIISKFYGDSGFRLGQQFLEYLRVDPDEDPVDTQLEKHALLDALFGTNVWTQRFFEKDPFPYLKRAGDPERTPEETEKLLKKYYVYSEKYATLREKFFSSGGKGQK